MKSNAGNPLVRERSTVQSCAAAPFYGRFTTSRREHSATTGRTQSELGNKGCSETVHFVRRPFNQNAALDRPRSIAAGRRGLLPAPRRPLMMQKHTPIDFIEVGSSSRPQGGASGFVGVH